MKLPHLLSAATLLLAPLASLQAGQSATTDFSDGFPGAAGNGWSDGWKTYPSDPSSAFQIEILSEPPLAGAQNYLSIQRRPPKDGVAGSTSLYMIRPLEHAVATAQQPFTASWAYRWDDLENGSPDELVTTFVIFPESAGGGPTESLCYVTLLKQRWHVVHRGDGGKPFFQKTPLAADPGQSFTFKANVDPKSGTYTVEIESSSGESYASPAVPLLCTVKEAEALRFRAAFGIAEGSFKVSLGNIEIAREAAPQP